MSILNVTNLTDNPEEWITEKFMDAFDELQKELSIQFNIRAKYDFIDGEIDNLRDMANETLGKDLLSLIDNYLVNLDYRAVVKEWYKNNIN